MAKQELTLKQRKFIKSYIKTGNLAESAQNAGYNCSQRHGFEEIGYQNLRKLHKKIEDIMLEMGLDNTHLLKKLDEGLDSMIVKIASEKGIITDEKVYIDFPTRAKYLEMGFKLNGGFAPSEHRVTGKDGGPIKLFVADFGFNGDIENGNGNDQAETLHTEEK